MTTIEAFFVLHYLAFSLQSPKLKLNFKYLEHFFEILTFWPKVFRPSAVKKLGISRNTNDLRGKIMILSVSQ